MQFHYGKVPRAGRLSASGQELSREARARLQWMDFYRTHRNAALTCRRFGISRQTFYCWWRRFDPQNLISLGRYDRRWTSAQAGVSHIHGIGLLLRD